MQSVGTKSVGVFDLLTLRNDLLCGRGLQAPPQSFLPDGGAVGAEKDISHTTSEWPPEQIR